MSRNILSNRVLKACYAEDGGGCRRVVDMVHRGGGRCVIFKVGLVREWVIGLKKTIAEL